MQRRAQALVRAAGFGRPAARTGVDIFRDVYRTVSPQGKPDTASGVLALPADPQPVLPVVEFGHGTMVARADAPSVAPGDRGEVTYFAGAGYAAVEADYLGLGPGAQPYLDPAAETSASADMLRAAYTVAAAFLRQLAHPHGELLRLLRAEDTTCASWTPRVPVRLYASRSDTQVAYRNSADCQRALRAHGRAVPLIDLGNLDHFPPSTPPCPAYWPGSGS